MESFVKRLLKVRIIRYGLVGGIGIPINDLALFCFMLLLSNLPLTINASFMGVSRFKVNLLYAVASACAFEISTTINFALNQLFTYNDQTLHGWEWIKRAAKAQLTSLSALLLSYVVGLLLVYGLHVDAYLANPAGIAVAFVYNYFISKKLVFRPTSAATATTAIEDRETLPLKSILKTEPVPGKKFAFHPTSAAVTPMTIEDRETLPLKRILRTEATFRDR